MKRFLSILAATATLSVLPAKAGPNDLEAHSRLWSAIQSVGVTTLLNTPQYCNRNILGVYDSRRTALIVCQTGTNGYKPVAWSAEDLDTLRHEAHHLVQDCAAGRMGDTYLGNVFTDSATLESFVTNALTAEQIRTIVDSYRSGGASADDVRIELEAFAVAGSVTADSITAKILDWCGSK